MQDRRGELMGVTPQSDLLLYHRLLARARHYWPHIGAIFLLSMLASPLALLTPLPLKIAVDSAIGDHPLPVFLQAFGPAGGGATPVLVFAVALLLAVTLLAQLQLLALGMLRTYTGEKLVLDFRGDLFRHLQRLSLSYGDEKGTADSVYRVQHDAASIQSIVIDGVIPLVASFVTVAAMLYVAARIDWLLAVVALAIAPLLVAVIHGFRGRLRGGWREVKKHESSAQAVVHETLSALRLVRAFGQEDREQHRFERRSHAGLRAKFGVAVAEGLYGILVAMITAAGTGAVLFLGALHVQRGVLTLGELLLIIAYIAQLYAPLKTVSSKAARLQSHLASAERAFALLDELPDVAERPHAKPLGRAAGAFRFRNVGFAYEPGRPVLHGIDLDVPAGTRIGIYGTTGAGKTTLLSLLTRFHDLTSGTIELDSVDLRDYRLADLRGQFAIVLQEPVLLSTTIAENIAYGRPDAGDRDIVAAAAAAGVDEFIAGLPDGFETQVGERGMRLSGGERQRISLAREFLKDAPILILDEPTSSVDTRTEASIMEAMERLMTGRTSFMIAHRLSTLDVCDMRVQIEGGRIVSAPRDDAATPVVHTEPASLPEAVP
ncbi:MAG: ABC transporter ATP-binding protein [Planctomycetota bacterium]|jgi:ATP-binding cassette subfamily B protein